MSLPYPVGGTFGEEDQGGSGERRQALQRQVRKRISLQKAVKNFKTKLGSKNNNSSRYIYLFRNISGHKHQNLEHTMLMKNITKLLEDNDKLNLMN